MPRRAGVYPLLDWAFISGCVRLAPGVHLALRSLLLKRQRVQVMDAGERAPP